MKVGISLTGWRSYDMFFPMLLCLLVIFANVCSLVGWWIMIGPECDKCVFTNLRTSQVVSASHFLDFQYNPLNSPNVSKKWSKEEVIALKKHLQNLQGQGQVKACTAYEQLPLFAEERNSLGLRAGNSFFPPKTELVWERGRSQKIGEWFVLPWCERLCGATASTRLFVWLPQLTLDSGCSFFQVSSCTKTRSDTRPKRGPKVSPKVSG